VTPGSDPMSRGPSSRNDAEASDRDDLARGAGVNYLGHVARLGARAPFLFLAGILYGEAAFGIYTFGLAAVETGAALALFGMKRSLSKWLSDAVSGGEDIHGVMAKGIALALCTGTLITLALAAGSGPMARAFGLPGAALPLLVLCLALPMIVLSDILLVAIRFTRQMRFEVYARSILEPVTLTVSVVILYYLGAESLGLVLGYVAALTAAAGATLVFFVRLYDVRKVVRAPVRWQDLRALVSFTGPTAAYELAVLLANRADVFLVSYFTPAASVGIYGMAREFSTVTKKIRQGFNPILRPVLADSIAAGALGRARDQLVTVSRWILSTQVPVILIFVFFAHDLLGLLGGQFAGGALVLILLMVGDAVEGALGVNEVPIVYLRPRANISIGVLWLLTNLGLGFWLVQSLGPEGMALAVALSLTVVNAARVGVNRLHLGLDTLEAKLVKPLVAAVPALAAGWGVNALLGPFPPWTLVAGIPTLLVVYLGGLLLLGLDPQDRAQLRRLRDRIRTRGPGPPRGEDADSADSTAL